MHNTRQAPVSWSFMITEFDSSDYHFVLRIYTSRRQTIEEAMKTVGKGDTIRVRFSSRTSEGIPFESPGSEETEIVTIGDKKINPEFEDALIGMSPGEKKTVELPCEKAYGKYRKTLVLRLKRKKLDLAEEPEPGKYLKISLDGKETGFVKVMKVTNSYIVVDANHPMAGEDMIYDLELVDIISKGETD